MVFWCLSLPVQAVPFFQAEGIDVHPIRMQFQNQIWGPKPLSEFQRVFFTMSETPPTTMSAAPTIPM